MTNEEAQKLHKKFCGLNAGLDNTPDAKLMQVYKISPELMNYIRGSKEVVAAFLDDQDIQPEF